MVDLRVLGIFVVAGPGLVNVERASGHAEGEGRAHAGSLGNVAVIVDVAVEEILQPRAVGIARHLLWERGVRYVKGHGTRRYQMRRCRVDVRAEVGELLDGP